VAGVGWGFAAVAAGLLGGAGAVAFSRLVESGGDARAQGV
jgi:hypothetical protein